MAAGIEDVARAAGVSTATVSRALRGLPNVNEATRERVRSAAARLGYVASPSAASLASGRTRSIGLLTPWVNRWYFANVIEGAERTLRAHGFDALLYTFDVGASGRRERVDPDVLRRRVDGVLVVALPIARDEVAALRGLGHPLVCVGYGDHDLVTVRLDDGAAAREATEHLLALGHRRIGHLTRHAEGTGPTTPPAVRRAGFHEALRAAGLEPDPRLEEEDEFDLEGGRAAMARLLERVPDVTAVFAASDEMAMGAVLALRGAGRRVPDDVSVIGVDGHDLGELVDLTTMSQPAEELGAAAARLVLDMIAGVDVPSEVVVPTALLRRGSTASPPLGRGAIRPA